MGWTSAIPIFGKLISGVEQGALANKINPQDVTYSENPNARKNLATVENLFNAPIPGMSSAYKRIGTNMANRMANVQRNATDSSTALAVGAGAQAEADAAAENLAMKEGQQKYSLIDDLTGAYKMLIGEGDKVYGDQLRKYNNDVNAKSRLREASENNYAGFASDLLSVATLGATSGWFSGKKTPTPKVDMVRRPIEDTIKTGTAIGQTVAPQLLNYNNPSMQSIPNNGVNKQLTYDNPSLRSVLNGGAPADLYNFDFPQKFVRR